ncbi:ROK family transcriptional regulator [Nocardioides albidus]|uniref:ROK family transcriptional regulator n=1 Tax=Nocardioides albidus TaxID=1517589 RepID=A0A5C4VPW5_9ACTN|nr:ROK family transcriptional regulator [Nocardioides albidus]TNM37369.1 ROK family transcriptional regulator [Nocardioides albidus]
MDARSPGSQAALREANRARLLAALRAGTARSQADLARATGLAPATVSNIVRQLEREGTVTTEESAGRRQVRLLPRTGVAASIDYGHRHVTVAIADDSPRILAERRLRLERHIDAREGLQVARRLLDLALEDASVELDDLVSIGMGLPAPIDRRTGRVGSPAILPGWRGVAVVELATEALGRPVAVDNDANLGALAEYRWGHGRHQEIESLVFIKLSEGVGAGLVIDGALFSGRDGTAGEIGHTTIDEHGAMCRCGNRGCLETLVSARAIVEALRPVLGEDREITLAEVAALAEEGDAACTRVLQDAGAQIGRSIASLCNLLNVQIVVIGGEMAQAGDLLLDAIRPVVHRFGIPSAVERLELVTTDLGARAPLLGGIALAFDLVQPR